jgi:hypothetical protein
MNHCPPPPPQQAQMDFVKSGALVTVDDGFVAGFARTHAIRRIALLPAALPPDDEADRRQAR